MNKPTKNKKTDQVLVTLFSLIILITFASGSYLTKSKVKESIDLSYLAYKDILIIYIVNAVNILLISFTSFIGYSIPITCKLLFNIGVSANNYKGPAYLFFIASIPHGICELLVLFYIFRFTVYVLMSYKNLYKFSDLSITKTIVKEFITESFVKINLLLVLGAFL